MPLPVTSTSLRSGRALETILPPELMDKVVNYMSADKSSLTTCSLLSHRWRSSAFPKLFRSITVYIEDMVKTPPCNWTSDHTLDALAGLLASDGAFESKVLVAYVKHLRVVGNGFYSNRPVDVECLFSIIDKLNLDSFCLSGAYLTSCLPEAFKAVCASQHPIPKKLRLLRLDDVCIYPLAALTRALKEEENEEKEKQDEDGDEDDSDDDDLDEDNNDDDTDDDDDDDEDEEALTVCPLVQFLNMFYQIVDFEICDVYFWRDLDGQLFGQVYNAYWDDPAHALLAASSVSSSFLVGRLCSTLDQGDSHEDILDIFRLSNTLCQLRYLELSKEMGPYCRKMLKSVGHHLAHLHITLQDYSTRWDDELDHYGVSMCTMLSTFCLTSSVLLHSIGIQLPRVCDATTNIICNLPRTLSQFDFNLVYSPGHHERSELYLGGLPWVDIDAQLSSRGVADVKIEFSLSYEFKLRNEDRVVFDKEPEFVKEKLPLLRASNVLVVCVPPEQVES